MKTNTVVREKNKVSNFNKAYDETMGHEGGYANNPNDKGGETYKGVARKKNPAWKGWIIIDDYKKRFPNKSVSELNSIFKEDRVLLDGVKQLYREKYYDPFKGDSMPEAIACEMFDTAVNMGPGQAVLFLQEALNLLNKDQRLHKDIAVDGGFGPNTTKCLNHILKAKSNNEKYLIKLLNGLQCEKYINIMRKDSTQEEFVKGWLNRV